MVARDGSGPRHRPATAELLHCFVVDPHGSMPSVLALQADRGGKVEEE